MRIDIERYEAVKEHLLSFGYDRLKQTGHIGARKKTANKWFETQDSISYSEDFSRQKIVWIELSDRANFCLDNHGFYINNTIFFMSGDRLPYITSFLNSKLCQWYFTKIAATSGTGTRRWIKVYVEQICIPPSIDNTIELHLENLVKEMHKLRDEKKPTHQLEADIDSEIYRLLSLSNEEIEFIELFNKQ